MGQPAACQGDKIEGQCSPHTRPGGSGSPVPAGPMGFSAPLTLGLAPSVLIDGRPAAVQGSSGLNTPPHVGLHPSDPFMSPTQQAGRVVMGSATVLFEGKPAASSAATTTMCFGAPGRLTGTATSVMIGG